MPSIPEFLQQHNINIDDLGPIHHASIPVPAGGGVVVMIGPNGCGKSHVVHAVEALTSKAGRIVTRDGAPRGEISAFGATLRVAQKLSRLGTLEVQHLDGKFNISDLVDPQLKDPVPADRKRIKALIQLSGQGKANVEPFYTLVGGQEPFTELVSPSALETDDMVTMAEQIKREFERIARTCASSAEILYGQAEIARGAAAGVNINAPHDKTALDKALELAVVENSQLGERAKAAVQAAANAAQAKDALAKAKAEYKGLDVSTASYLSEEAGKKLSTRQSTVDRLKRELEEAEGLLVLIKHEKELADRTLAAAQTKEATVEEFRKLAEATIPPEVGLDDIEAANSRVEVARSAVETGILVRKAKEELEKAVGLKEDAVEAERKSILFREAAGSIDTVLSNCVQGLGVPLAVSGGRLVTETDRGTELFADLSRGEQYKLAIGIAVKAVGPGGIIPLPQEAWEGLDPSNRQIIAAEVENTGVIILTAEATDDPELGSMVFDPFPLSVAE